MNRIVLKAQDLDGFLAAGDKESLAGMDALFAKALASFEAFERSADEAARSREKAALVSLYDEMGHLMQDVCAREDRVKVYSFVAPKAAHAEASRLIAKLRDVRTPRDEFVYYTQRAFELLFNLAYGGTWSDRKNHLIVRTPVSFPVQNFAVHKIPDVDDLIENSVMCVMLRGALLPSIIMSKEIEEYSSHEYVTPFALFRIKRNDSRQESNMEYVLDLDRSYFKLEELEGKDLIFADPMNATGGSLITVVRHILDSGVKPRSVKIFNAISALKGALRIVRALPEATVYTLWMDPVLNELAYIMPGLGDAGDRINGADSDDAQRGILQLIADYGAGISNLYRSQIRMIEGTVLRK